MEDSKKDNSRVSPSEACEIPATADENTAVKGAEGYEPSLKNPTEGFPNLRPIRERTMTEKGYAYWLENREVRRKNRIYFEENIDSLISQLNDLMTSYHNTDHVKQSLHKLLGSYSDLSRQLDNEDQKLDDAGFLRISTEVRNTELQVTKWLHDFESCEKTSSKHSNCSKSSKHTSKTGKSKSSGASSVVMDSYIRNKTKLAELKKKAEHFEKEKQAEAMLDRTRLEKELAVAEAADKVHREFIKDEYSLSHLEEQEGVASRDKFQMKSKVQESFNEKDNDELLTKAQKFVSDPYKNMFASKQYIDEPQVKYRNMAATKPSTVPLKAKSFMPLPDVYEPLPHLPRYKDQVERTKPSSNVETMELLYRLMTRQGEIFQRQGVPEPKLSKFGGDPMGYQYFMTMFQTIVEARVQDPIDRLILLIDHTYGEAKSIIETCLYLEPTVAYERAKTLLQENYGNPILIANLYMEKLRQWPRILEGDGKSIREFLVFLIKCESVMSDQSFTNELNTSSLLQSLCIKLPMRMQGKWLETAHIISFRDCRRVAFCDFVSFIRKESELANDPTYSPGALSKAIDKRVPKNEKIKAPRESFKSKFTSFATESNNENVNADSKEKLLCLCCNKDHDIDSCSEFLAKSPYHRKLFVVSKRLCFGCYSSEHSLSNCQRKRVCQQENCGGAHPTALHGTHKFKVRNKSSKESSGTTSSKEISNGCTKASEESFSTTIAKNNTIMCLSVLPMMLHHKNNPEKALKVYGMLDNCSQGSFISQDMLHMFDVKGISTRISIKTLTGTTSEDSCLVDGFVVSDFAGKYTINLPKLYTRRNLPISRDEIPTENDVDKWEHLRLIKKEIPEADPDAPIALLIGVNCPAALRPLEVIAEKNNGPYAQRTALGWSIIGPISQTDQRVATVKCNRIAVVDSSTQEIAPHHIGIEESIKDIGLSKMLEDMYKQDFNEPSIKEMKKLSNTQGEAKLKLQKETSNSREDEIFLDKMINEVKCIDGHYELPLPFRNHNVAFPNNRVQAERRANWIKKKFVNAKYHEDYTNFMNDLIKNGYAEKIPQSRLETEKGHVWYLPHHGIYHPQKPGKMRVVFDCSCEFEGTSLNKELLQGPDLTNSLVGVLLRFRVERVAFLADIEAMFHQVRVPLEQRSYLRFLWWPNGKTNYELEEYQMCVHLFGAVSSPSCVNFALKQTAEDNEKIYGTEASETIHRNFYVDDLLKSTATQKFALDLITKLTRMCAAGGFRLTKFVSNDREVIASIPKEERAKGIKNIDLDQSRLPMERALGISWNIENDQLEFRITLKDQPLTRRGILATISSIYDPLGFVGPLLLMGRKILQQISTDKQSWDEPLPIELQMLWEKWRTDLRFLQDFKIDRSFKPESFDDIKTAQLHHFSDASSIGYGVASYLRLQETQNRIHCSLIMGKSRVVPNNAPTIPRLELTAATVATKVGYLVFRELPIQHIAEFYWTDSQVVLSYLKNDHKRFHTFVANRVKLICDHTYVEQWRYVPSECNPADYASRGLTGKQFLEAKDWVKGPKFLWDVEKNFPNLGVSTQLKENDKELKRSVSVKATTVNEENHVLTSLTDNVSSWYRMKRTLAIIMGIANQRKFTLIEPTVSTLEIAEQKIIKWIQRSEFDNTIRILETSPAERSNRERKRLLRKSNLLQLDPFLDKNGILRVGGRLRRSSLNEDLKHPIIIPSKGQIPILITRHCHNLVYHAGRGITVNEIRRSGYWIMKCGVIVRKIISDCTLCHFLRGKVGQQKMADLPEERVSISPPFTYCGIDYFGPFVIKEKRKEVKRYGVLFTCLYCRAVHIEVANSLDTDSFIMALRRFISIRGNVREIRSDWGTNLVGAERELQSAVKEMDHRRIKDFLLYKGCDYQLIRWKRNPPSASNMGGVWERQIGTVRSILLSMFKAHGTSLHDEAFRTLIAEIAAIINSRPLTVDNLDRPDDPLPLCPANLLTMKSKVISAPPGNFEKSELYSKRYWRRVQHLSNEFWQRWQKEYLNNLQKRTKWSSPEKNFKKDDIVLIADKSLARNKWLKAKVIGVRQDDQGMVRSVILKTANIQSEAGKLIERPINKLVLLYRNGKKDD